MNPSSSTGSAPKKRSPTAPSKASTTRFEWLPDDPTAFAPMRPWKSRCITTWDDCRSQNQPTDSAEEADFRQGLIHFPAEKRCNALSFPLLPEAAEALLSYLRERGDATSDRPLRMARSRSAAKSSGTYTENRRPPFRPYNA